MASTVSLRAAAPLTWSFPVQSGTRFHARSGFQLAPRGEYGAPRNERVRSSGSSALSQLRTRQSGELEIDRLRGLFGSILAGRAYAIDEDVYTLQAIALEMIDRTFGHSHDSNRLRERVREKRPAFAGKERDALFEHALFKGRSEHERGRDLLCFLLRTFQGGEHDAPLREAVYAKLGKMGTPEDLDAILPHVRRATTGRDLFYGLAAIREMTGRLGAPSERGNLHMDPTIGPLLARTDLSASERQTVIEEVLRRGKIEKVSRFESGEYHGSEVFVVEFAEKFADENRPIRAAFKPEQLRFDHTEAMFSREVLAYELDRRFFKTGLINPTVEAFLQVHDHAFELGSLSYWEPRAKPYARRPPGRGHEALVPPNDPLPEHRHLGGEPWFLARLAQLRTLIYILNNDDLIANNVNPRDNLANILVVVDKHGAWDARAIDWAASAGGNRNSRVYEDLDTAILPKKPDAALQAAIAKTPKDAVVLLAREFVKDGDAEKLAGRMVGAFNELERRT